MSIVKIYTKTGDKGETGLIDGSRVSKSNLRIIAYGEVDEVNSHIGYLISNIESNSIFTDIKEILVSIQQDLFVLGAELANPSSLKENKLLVKEEMISNIEKYIDNFEDELLPITYFILPGGTIESSLLHICRTVVRRAETSAVALAKKQQTQNVLLLILITIIMALVSSFLLYFLDHTLSNFIIVPKYTSIAQDILHSTA